MTRVGTRGIQHLDEYREMENLQGSGAAAAYVRDIARNLNLASEALRNLNQPLSYLDPREQEIEYRFSQEKVSFDLATYIYSQTYLNTPVWSAGVTVTLKQDPTRIVGATDTSEQGINAELPSSEALQRYRQLFASGEEAGGSSSAGRAAQPEIAKSDLLNNILGHAVKAGAGLDAARSATGLIRGRFFIYRYEARERIKDDWPTLPLPAVPNSIQDGRWYLVAELVFRLPHDGAPMNWRILVEVETNTILYLRALSSGLIKGNVFPYDPVTSTGIAANTADKGNDVLNPHREDDALHNLNPPSGMPLTQSLEGRWAVVTNITSPDFQPPTRPAGCNFDIWDVRSNEFAAVNAYYHVDRFFRLVEDLGFQIVGPHGYFGGTQFPVAVDHRAFRAPWPDGNVVNASLVGHADGINSVYYALADFSGGFVTRVIVTNGGSGYTSPPTVSFTAVRGSGATASVKPEDIVDGAVTKVTVQQQGAGYLTGPLVEFKGSGGTGAFAVAEIDVSDPIGIATDWRVSLHELGGHGTLFSHVGESQFKFAHSAGDSFAMILNDYLSEWHNNGKVPDRFQLVPFLPAVVQRRSDRGVAEQSVAKVNITNSGSGYLTVSFVGGGGNGAKAGVLNQHIIGGTVTKVTVIEPGTGYTTAPSVVFGGGGGTGATATAQIGAGSVTGITVTGGGSGYKPLSVKLSGGGVAAAVVKPADIAGGAVTQVTVTDPGAGYSTAPSASFIGGGGTGITATVQIGTSGSVTGVTVDHGGSGYTTAPTVSFTGGGVREATASVKPEDIVGGAVTKVTVGEQGTGYTCAPSVVITGGGGTGASATAEIGTWGWGGGMDQGTDGKLGSGYLSEQILSTTMFRAYRSIGGDAANVNRRAFAARYMTFLMLQAIGLRNSTNNPSSPDDFLHALRDADATDWTSEGVIGGAYRKVLDWAFEKQNLNNGVPPSVDVYIDDGRAGEYQYVPVYWASTTIWNRRKPDGLSGHQAPELGQINHAYVKIRNWGTSVANTVIVRGYHCKPSAGLLWPDDLQPFTTPQLPAGTLQPNNSEERTVGPFEWTPVVNAWGHDCMLMVVSAAGDPSNVDKFTKGKVIEDWRLVPNDNNIAQRNVVLAPGGGGLEGLMAALDGKGFWIGNPGRSTANIAAAVVVPPFLAQRGWRIGLRDLPSEGMPLAAREQRLVIFEIDAGETFSKADAEAAAERDIVVTATANGAIIGGMIYRIDPKLDMPFNDGKSTS